MRAPGADILSRARACSCRCGDTRRLAINLPDTCTNIAPHELVVTALSPRCRHPPPVIASAHMAAQHPLAVPQLQHTVAGNSSAPPAEQHERQPHARLPLAPSSLVGAACAALGSVCGITGMGGAAPARLPQQQPGPTMLIAAASEPPCELCASESLPSRITSLGAVSYSSAGDDGGGSRSLPNTSRKRRSLFISSGDVLMCDAPPSGVSAPSAGSDAGDGMEDVPLCDLAPLQHMS